MPPEVTQSTGLYVLLAGVWLASLRWSVTEVMMSHEPSQKKVAMTASPWWGFVRNLLRSTVPLSLSVPPCWPPTTSRTGVPRRGRSGLRASLQPAASSAAASRRGRPATVVHLDIIPASLRSVGTVPALYERTRTARFSARFAPACGGLAGCFPGVQRVECRPHPWGLDATESRDAAGRLGPTRSVASSSQTKPHRGRRSECPDVEG